MREAVDVLEKKGYRGYVVLRVPHYPWLGKLNINNVYYALDRALERLGVLVDYVATIEADVVLEERYFEKILQALSSSEKTCIAGGSLAPYGLPKDPFPFSRLRVHLWGANRVYRYSCWRRLNRAVDIRLLPAWDTDHVVLAVAMGYLVVQVPHAESYTKRHVRPFKGYGKGYADGSHGLPAWWALYKAATSMDPEYLAGYAAARIGSGKGNPYLRILRQVYRRAARRELVSMVRGFWLKQRSL